MFHIKWRNHWFKKTEMATMISLMSTTLTNINTHLENMLKLIIKRCRNQIKPNNHWLRLHLSIQLDLNHHLQIGNTMYHISSSNHLTGRTWLIRMITLIITTLISTSIILEIMHKCPILSCRSTLFIQLVLNHHLRIGNMTYLIKCWNQ